MLFVQFVQCIAVCTNGGGFAGADVGRDDSEALLGVADDRFVGAVDWDGLLLAFDEFSKFKFVFQIINVGRDALQGFALSGVHLGTQFAKERGHVVFVGLGKSAAQHDDAVEDGDAVRDGVSGHFAKRFKSLAGGSPVADQSSFGNPVDVKGIRICGCLWIVAIHIIIM